MPATITAASVSRRLAQKYTRSTTHPTRIKGYPLIRSGFRVFAGSGGGAYVEWYSGERRFARIGDQEKAARNNLEKYQAFLDQWYVTKINGDSLGGLYLSVLGFK
jgi:hypothetical protein